jgi:hypothetical protein
MEFERKSAPSSKKKRSSHLKLVPERKDDEDQRGGPKTWH